MHILAESQPRISGEVPLNNSNALRKGILVVRLSGGMGNQMFQYASARALALQHELELVLDVSGGFDKDPYGRHYELGCFKVAARLLSETEVCRLNARGRFRKYTLFVAERIAIRRFGQFFLPLDLFVRWGNHICLLNRLQSYRYFESVASVIRGDFSFPDKLPAKLHDNAKQIAGSASVSIHLRLQHGMSDDGSAVHDQQRIRPAREVLQRFYCKAIQTIAASVHGAHFFLFSDSEAMMPLELKGLPVTQISRDRSDPSWCDMWLMSQCKYNIVANSTYSWWAAWLNSFPGKKVYAPRQFLPFISKHYPRNVYPSEWNVL